MREASRASEFRVRLELSERAESTLREELAEERHRREEAERERDDLRRELHALREPPGAPEMVEEEPERVAENPSDAVEPQGAYGALGGGGFSVAEIPLIEFPRTSPLRSSLKLNF